MDLKSIYLVIYGMLDAGTIQFAHITYRRPNSQLSYDSKNVILGLFIFL